MDAPRPDPSSGLADILPDWFRRTARELPWRRPDTSAWGVLLSEVMLQQTPAARVAPIWVQWIARWPQPKDMANTPVAEVLRAWGSLGYPRRALRLHACATVLAAEHGGTVPPEVEVLLTLPGVGAYTARAVACFSYGQRVPVVDTNVRRVVARAVHGRAEPAAPSTARDLADTDALLPADAAAATVLSAALMELGAVLCTARRPQCEQCPVSSVCAWVQAGRPEYDGPPRTGQRFAGTHRQARGQLMSVLRASTVPVTHARLDLVWPQDPEQRRRALDSLVADGLVELSGPDHVALTGEGGAGETTHRTLAAAAE